MSSMKTKSSAITEEKMKQDVYQAIVDELYVGKSVSSEGKKFTIQLFLKWELGFPTRE